MDARSTCAIRRATPDDVEAFTAQRRAIFGEMMALAPGPIADQLDAGNRAAFRDSVERGVCLAWLAISPPGEVVGSSALFLVERLPSPSNPSAVEGYIAHVFVVPAWRRSGLGSALVRAAVDEATSRGLGRIRLHATEPGRALYESCGFRLRTNDMEIRL